VVGMFCDPGECLMAVHLEQSSLLLGALCMCNNNTACILIQSDSENGIDFCLV
jgi:hypothetical protein